MLMIVGLGNPGQKYATSKHNVGWMVLDALADRLGVNISKLEFDAATATARVNGEKVMLVEPQTFMNASGKAVGQLMNYYQVDISELIVVQDDLDLPLGKLRLRAKGAAGGHNGIKDIIAATGSRDFARVKIGTDHPQKESVVDWVLSPFSKTDAPVIQAAVDKAVDLLMDYIDGDDVPTLMNRYN